VLLKKEISYFILEYYFTIITVFIQINAALVSKRGKKKILPTAKTFEK